MFQLEKALAEWKSDLTISDSMSRSDVEELESHLLDEIDALKEKNLSDEECFYVALNRIGSIDLLTNEYGKVNFNSIWVKKIMWLIGGFLIITFVQKLIQTITFFITYAIYRNEILGPDQVTRIDLVVNIVISGILLWLIFIPKYKILLRIQSLFNYLFSHTKWLLLIIFLAFIFMNSIGFGLITLPYRMSILGYGYGNMMVGENYFSMLWWIILALIFITLSFKNHKAKSTIA